MLKKSLIPAILANNKKQLIAKIDQIEDFVESIQIDFTDGKFARPKTQFTSQDLYKLNPQPSVEAHLMIENPEKTINDWIMAGAEKIILHVEAKMDWQKILQIYQENFIKLYLAINPDTPLNKLDEKMGNIDGVTIMSVDPGRGHQKFQSKVLSKIKTLRNRYPNLNIQIDGGMHLKPKNTIEQALLAGANEIVCGSEIFVSNNPIKKIEELEDFINHFDQK
ncbi:MAG: hypothetical protein ACOZAR_05445 [Patescibacteria group bacterium]